MKIIENTKRLSSGFSKQEPNDWLDRAISTTKNNFNDDAYPAGSLPQLKTINTTENRKFVRWENALLDGIVDAYIETATEDPITRIYTLIDDVKDLDAAIKMKIRNSILKRFQI